MRKKPSQIRCEIRQVIGGLSGRLGSLFPASGRLSPPSFSVLYSISDPGVRVKSNNPHRANVERLDSVEAAKSVPSCSTPAKLARITATS
jgi:hypothetical protein